MDANTPREKPFFIAEACDVCETQLQRVQDGFYDEWTCPDSYCESSEAIWLDWPEEDLEKLEKAAEGDTVPVAEMMDELPFETEEELREALGVPESFEIVVSRQTFSSTKKRGDCQ